MNQPSFIPDNGMQFCQYERINVFNLFSFVKLYEPRDKKKHMQTYQSDKSANIFRCLNSFNISRFYYSYQRIKLLRKVSSFKILIRIRTPNRGIDPTVTQIHETTCTQTTSKKALKRLEKFEDNRR